MSSNPTSLADLKAHFDQRIEDRTLVLTPADAMATRLAAFVTGLPGGRLPLSEPDLRLTDSSLTVTATTTGTWPIGGDGAPLRPHGVRLVFTGGPDFAVALHVTGTVPVGGTDVAISGDLDPTGRLVVALDAGPAGPFPLTVLADFVSGTLARDLPPGVAIFDSVPLSRLSLALGYAPASPSEVTVGADLVSATWSLIDGFDLTDIGVTLTRRVSYPDRRRMVSVGGDIHATVRFGGTFTVRLALRGRYDWLLEILPADGNVLPGLAALAELVGGQELVTELQHGLANLGLTALSVDAVGVGLDMAARKPTYVSVNSHITIDDLTFDIQVMLPDFRFNGRLSPATPLSLNALVGKYFAGATAFPSIVIDEFAVAAAPGIGRYSLSARIVTEWHLTVGPIAMAFHGFAFEITKDSTGVTGGIEGYFALFDAEFYASAKHPDAGGGWQFDCQSRPGQRLTIKAIHDRIVTAFGVDSHLPAAIEGLALSNLDLWFDTGSGDARFTCEATFPIDDQTVDIVVTIRLDSTPTGYAKTFDGHITIGGLVFDLTFAQNAASTVFVATYTHTGERRPLRIRDLVTAVSPALAESVPADLEIDLRDVVFVFSRGTESGFLFGLELGVQFGLSQLPLVGQQFPADRKVGIDSLQVLVASRAFTVAEIGPVNALLPAGVPRLPDVTTDARQGQPAPPDTTVALTEGVTVSARLLLGGDGTAQTLSLPAAPTPPTTQGGAVVSSASGPAATASDTARWFDVQRSFGPVYFDRIGFDYHDRTVRFLLDAALSAAGLTLSLEGLAFGSPIDHFSPTFDLRGLGVDYRNGPVEIGGALLRTTITEAGRTYDEYDGAAVIRTERLTMAALGSYAYVNDAPSLFVYAVLDAALGGPPFFFVTGLAAGFGYNRTVIVPPIEKIADFPLVTAAKSPQPITGNPSPGDLIRSTVAKMRAAIPPSAGAMFLAIGVKFLSFRIIDSFALIIASLGRRFELNVLGVSTVVAPTPEAGQTVTPLAEIQLALKASFVPDEGFLGVSAQLTDASYLFSCDCHLTGGFAFYSWFAGEHAGDFVLTVGGYHPQFRPPATYPQVPRLGFNWQVDPHLVIKGDAYYALTPVALMAGGHLEAVWQSGNLRAAFIMGADFIVAWKPYHYDATAYVDINASYTFELFGTHHINVDLGASVHIWGPEFAGTAHITLAFISFDVSFGPQTQRDPKAIDWTAFSQSFLPSSGRCAVAVSGGMLRKNSAATTDLGVLDPQRLVLRTNTVIPSTAAHIRGALAIDHLYYTGTADAPVFAPFTATGPNTTPTQAPTAASKPAGPVAIGPMGIRLPGHDGPHLNATLTITITRGSEPMEHHFAYVPVLEHLPAGMWGGLGQRMRPDPNDPPLVRDTLVGFEIRPATTPLTGADHATVEDTELLQYHLPTLPGGTYHVEATQVVLTDEQAGGQKIPKQLFHDTGDFVVTGSRPAIAPDEIYAVYPPDGALGDYSTDLPHVILNHSTLPWQESADPSRDDVPWLALLLFDETDLPAPRVVTIGSLRKPGGPVFPAANLDASQPDGDQVTVIDVAAGRLRQLLPAQDRTRRDLVLLTHVRRGPDGTERAVVIGNRLPRPGARHVAHLVSIRNRYDVNGFDTQKAGPDTPVRLISLHSWRFACTTSDQDAAGLLHRIAGRGGPLCRPGGAAEAARGYLRVGYLARTGRRQDAWYRGPLVPTPMAQAPAGLPAHSADDLMPQGDLPDVGFATAWQLGRLLALRAKPFAAAVYRWKRARAQARKSGGTEVPPVPAVVTSWLNDLALLHGVPFNNLVADEAMLPVESLRFCSLHAGWVACLLDGALSIGRVTPADVQLDRTLAADIRATGGDAVQPWTRHVLGDPAELSVSGFLLRSDTVAGWPDLRVTATNHSGTAPVLRPDVLSANTALWLFSGEISAVSLQLPTHVLHFGLGADAPRWQRGDRIVDITSVATNRIGAPAAAAGASASFAARMMAPPPKADIRR